MNEDIKQEKDLTVIMPALNEEMNIGAALDDTFAALDFYGINGEIIVINDGSKDKTAELVNERIAKNKQLNLRLINHDKPLGIGASFWDGFERSSGKLVVLIPGDNEVIPKEILRYCSLLEQVDIVVPFVFNRQVRSFFRRVISSLFVSIINTTFNSSFIYTNGTVIYRKCVLREISYHCAGFFYQTDILVRLARKGYLYAQVPYKLGIRAGGGSTALTLRSLLKVIRGYLRLVRDIYFHKNKSVEILPDCVTFKRRNS